MSLPETLAKRLLLARLRLAAGRGEKITPPMIAKKIGVSSATVSRYESGSREPNLGTIVLLAAALEVTPAWLAFGEGANAVPLLPGELPPLPDARPVPRPVPRPQQLPGHRRRA